MAEQAPPKIAFPCDYAIKVVGDAADDFEAFVLASLEDHAELATASEVRMRASSNGRFVSITVTIVATGETQLRAIFETLKASGRVHMVL